MNQFWALLICISFSNIINAQFSEPQIISDLSGRVPTASSTIDLDGDGDLDILQESGYDIRWVENNAGSLAPSKVIVTADFGSADNRCTTTDIDNDGDLDIVCTELEQTYVSYNTNGAFSELELLKETPYIASAFIFADINEDMKVDLLVYDKYKTELVWISDFGSSDTSMNVNVIDSTVDLSKKYRTYAYDLKLVDINLDGRSDIVGIEYIPEDGSVSESYRFIWYENYGAGNFSSKKELLNESARIENYWLGNLNGDQGLDIVYTTKSPRQTKVARYQKDTPNDDIFYVSEEVLTLSEKALLDIAIADIDSDGDNDVLAREPDLILFENTDGLGTLGARQLIKESSSYSTRLNLSVFDFDNDGDQDILNKNHILENKAGEQRPFFTQEITLLFGSRTNILKFADLDNDGFEDAIIEGDQDYLEWRKNLGNKVFSDAMAIPFQLPYAHTVHTIDFDHDGDLDLFIPRFNSDDDIAGYWLENTDGQGQFSSANTLRLGFDGTVTDVKFTDMNGDGLHDLIFSTFRTGYSSDNSILYSENLGNGQFEQAISLFKTTHEIDQIEVLDIDLDGDMDIILDSNYGNHSTNGNRIILIENTDGEANFSPEPPVLFFEEYGGHTLWRWILSDIDGDGDEDILATYHGVLYAYYNEDGQFDSSKTKLKYLTGNDRFGLQRQDFDGDGNLDLMTTSGSRVVWYANTSGSGALEEHVLPYNISSNNAAYLDIDLDGDIDVIDLIGYILENKQEKYSFNTVERLDASYEVEFIESIDVNNDGNLDLLTNNIYNESYPYSDYLQTDHTKVLYWNELKTDKSSIGKSHALDVSSGHPNSFDFDNDGDLDIVSVVFPGNNAIQIFRNNGTSYEEPFEIHCDDDLIIDEVHPFDFDGDGDVDFIYNAAEKDASYRGGIYILENVNEIYFKNHYIGFVNAPSNIFLATNADNSATLMTSFRNKLYQIIQDNVFSRETEKILLGDYWTSSNKLNVLKIDLDEDGNEDLLDYKNNVWFENTGSGNLQQSTLSGSVINVSPGALFRSADVDLDDDQDIVYYDNGSIGWVENIGAPGYFNDTLAYDIGYTPNVKDLEIADMESDLDLDILYISDTEIGWIQNVINEPIEPCHFDISIYHDTSHSSTTEYKLEIASSGQEPYSYQWNNQSTESHILISTSGRYCVTVSDADGCTGEECLDFTVPIDSTFCAVEIKSTMDTIEYNAELIAHTEGVAPFEFQWSDNSSGNAIEVLESGEYCVTVTDAKACIADTCITINLPHRSCTLRLYQVKDSISDMVILKSEVISNDVISYLWSTGDTTSSITVVDSGEYCLETWTIHGCYSKECINITIEEPTCVSSIEILGDSNENVKVLSIESEGIAPFIYQWNDGTSGRIREVEIGGTYCVIVIDSIGCVSEACIEIQINLPECETQIILEELTTETAILSVETQGVGPYEYFWSNNAHEKQIEVSTSDQYCVEVIDSLGCISNTCIDIVLENSDSCYAEINVIANADSSEFKLIGYSTGVAPFSYNWNNGETTNFLQPSEDGTYCVTITDNSGCVADTCIMADFITPSLDIDIHPNPVQSNFNIVIQSELETNGILQVRDVSGNLLFTKSLDLYIGNQLINVNSDQYPAGVFFVSLQYGNEQKTIRFIKQ